MLARVAGPANVMQAPSPMSFFSRLFQDASARMATIGMEARLERGDLDGPNQQQVLRRLLEGFSRADYGKVNRLTPDLTWAELRKRVPLMSRADLEPNLMRGEHGGANLLWPETMEGVVGELVCPGEVERRYPQTKTSRHLFDTSLREALWAGSLLNIPASHFSEPFLSLSSQDSKPCFTLSDLIWESLGSRQTRVPLPIPERAGVPCALADGARMLVTEDATWLAAMFPEALLSTDVGSMLAERPTWSKHLNLLIHFKESCLGQADQAKLLLGHDVAEHQLYATGTGIHATRINTHLDGLRLLTDSGIHYEFLPIEHYDPTALAAVSDKTVSVEEIEMGRSYVLFVSTTAGLCRQDTGERIRCVGTAPLMIQPEGRIDRTVRLGGLDFVEADLQSSLLQCCNAHGWAIVHMHAAPCVERPNEAPNLEWWVELKPGSRQTPTGPLLTQKLDEMLARRRSAYREAREQGRLGPPVVRLVIPGIFREWLHCNRLLSPRFTFPRCLPNRSIANALAAQAKFCD